MHRCYTNATRQSGPNMNSVRLALALAVILPRAAPRMTTIDGGMGTKVVGRTRCPRGTPSEQLILFLHIHKAGGSSVTSSAFDSGLCGPKFSINGNPWSETPAATGRKPYYLYRPEVMAPAERRKYVCGVVCHGFGFAGWFSGCHGVGGRCPPRASPHKQFYATNRPKLPLSCQFGLIRKI